MAKQTAVLVLDDDPIVLNSLSEYLRIEGYDVNAAQTLQEAIELLDREQFRVVLTDVRLPEGSGFDLLQHIKSLNLSTSVIMLTGYGTIEDAVRAIKMGAFDYVTKPIADDEVKLAIERALQQQQLVEENRRLRQQLNMSYHFDNIVCRDPKMRRVLDMINVVADTDTTVLITGESGTGKTLAARAIHTNSHARRQAVRRGQLRHAARHAAGERAVRPRAGRLQRGHREQAGQVRRCRQGHDLPGRDLASPARRCR